MNRQPPSDLAGLVRLGISEALFVARTIVPARVEKWSPEEQTIDAQPLIQRMRIIDGERLTDDYPVITRIPVSFIRWGGFVIRCPIRKNDIVTLVVSDRELERWLAGDGASPVEPRGGRIGDLNDAIAIPGIAPWSNPLPNLDDDALVIGRENGDGELRILPDGSIELGSADATKRGIARSDDETTSDSSTDSAFWTKFAAIDAFIQAAGGAVYGNGGPVLAGALTAYNAAGAAPTSQTGKITSASDAASTE